jgi:hypothetical protein
MDVKNGGGGGIIPVNIIPKGYIPEYRPGVFSGGGAGVSTRIFKRTLTSEDYDKGRPLSRKGH